MDARFFAFLFRRINSARANGLGANGLRVLKVMRRVGACVDEDWPASDMRVQMHGDSLALRIVVMGKRRAGPPCYLHGSE